MEQVTGAVSGLGIPDANGVLMIPQLDNPGAGFTTGTVTIPGLVVGGGGC
jgi:hypothetical protein